VNTKLKAAALDLFRAILIVAAFLALSWGVDIIFRRRPHEDPYHFQPDYR
jgi:hypothetical protein